MNAVDQRTFVVALEALEADAVPGARCRARRAVDVGERLAAVDLRLARAEQIQVRAVQDEDAALLLVRAACLTAMVFLA